MNDPLVQFPNGNWVRASQIRGIAVRRIDTAISFDLIVVDHKENPIVVQTYPLRDEACAARDLPASNVNAALLIPERIIR